ncbi:MAG: TIGR01459 family HAD-type hydrolase [Pseudomonadota bacterium]
MTGYKKLAGLKEVIDDCHPKVVLLDLWGVVHNGQEAFPHAVKTLRELKARSIDVIILSNSMARAHKTREHLKALGISDDLYKGVLTSGELAFQDMKSRNDLGQKYLFLGNDGNDILTDPEMGGKYRRTQNPEEADFIVSEYAYRDKMAEFQALLKVCSEREIKMVNLNPDLYIERDGVVSLQAGVNARFYSGLIRNPEEKILQYGKPYKPIYDAAKKMASELSGATPDDIIAVGDGPKTDIAGGNNYGIKTVLTIHKGLVGALMHTPPGAVPPEDDLRAMLKRQRCEDAMPGYAIPAFQWVPDTAGSGTAQSPKSGSKNKPSL